MSLLTAPIVKHSQILAGIYFILLKMYAKFERLSVPNLDPNEKIGIAVIK